MLFVDDVSIQENDAASEKGIGWPDESVLIVRQNEVGHQAKDYIGVNDQYHGLADSARDELLRRNDQGL